MAGDVSPVAMFGKDTKGGFDILMSIRRQEKTISPFFVVLNWLVCLRPDWIPHGMSPQTQPLSTTEPLKLIETYL